MEQSHDKSFFQALYITLGVLVAFFFAIVYLADSIGSGGNVDPKVAAKVVAERTAPLATVVTDPSALVKASAPSGRAPLSGEQVVSQVCSACHGTGVLGAPKIGDKADWGARKSAAGGIDGLAMHAISGKNSMPPRGGNPDLSDSEIHAAIAYMLGKAGL